MLAMSNDGYITHKNSMAQNSILIYEKDLVKPEEHDSKHKAYGIPATRIAEELGRKIVLNIVMLGFFGAVTDIVPMDALRKAVESSVPAGTEELNLKAFDRGYEYGTKLAEKAVSRT
jgi:2-oxoglutarate ferredoxin oxidoreductase subunit gamma